MEEVLEEIQNETTNEVENLENEKPQEEAKYLVNIGHWVLNQDPSNNQTIVEPRLNQLFFRTRKEAEDKMKQLEISKMFKSPTAVGSVSFGIISLELVSIDKYVKWMKDRQEEEDRLKQQEEEQAKEND